MTYKVVTTKQAGDGLSAKEYNQFIKDNAAAGVPDIFTTKGDIAVATADDVASRLGVGTNGFLLKANSNQTPGVYWDDFCGGLVQGSEKVIATDTATTMRYTTEIYDTDTAQTTGSTNDYVFTIPTGMSGYYLIGCSIDVGGNASMEVNEYLKISIRVNSTIVSSAFQYYQGGNTQKMVWLWDILKISGGTPNQIEVVVLQNSGANVTAANGWTQVIVARLLGG